MEKLVVPVKTGIYRIRQESEKAREREGKNEEGERKIAVLEGQIATLKSENEAMRRLLGAKLPASWKFTPARVIGAPADDLQIDKGAQEGIKKGMAVVLDNVLVGKISWVGEHFSRVLLPSSTNAKILGITRSATDNNGSGGIKARGLLIGHGGKISLERVLTQESPEEGDLVLTAGDEDLPPDMVIGQVRKINKIEGQIYQEAEVKNLIEPKSLETVFVVTAR